MRDKSVSRFAIVLLWLLVINLGIAFGAGLYESRIVVPDWIDVSASSPGWNAEAARQDDTGRRFWVAVTTVPLTLVTLANLVAAWKAPLALRRWWLIAALFALADRVFTLGYFVPTMIGLTRSPNSADAIATATQWVQLNHVRHIIVAVAWLAALRTFSLLYSHRARLSGPNGNVYMTERSADWLPPADR
jgi:hypothetical protein